MSDLPILFSAPMVRAILDGRTTQTRRILTGLGDQPIVEYDGMFMWKQGYRWGPVPDPKFPPGVRCKVGDRLYVREHWRTFVSLNNVAPRDLLQPGKGAGIRYEADGHGLALTAAGERWEGPRDDAAAFGKHRRAMHMPKWASRITLTVTDVRIERLQDISDDDAIAEGIEFNPRLDPVGQCKWRHYGKESTGIYPPSASYGTLWDSINGPGAWDDDPWVVAYTFTVQMQNIDQIARAA